MQLPDNWVNDVLGFWFSETKPEQWFKKDEHFDANVRSRFLALSEALAAQPDHALLTDPRTALAAIIVFDQMSRNMFRGNAARLRARRAGDWLSPRRLLRGATTRT